MSTARVPHRVGRRRLRRLVEHRSTRPGPTAPPSVLEPVAPSGATGDALRGLAADLVDERRKVAELRREVAQLRSQLESVQPA